VNAVTSEAVDAVSLQPEFKFCAVALTKAPGELPGEFTPHQKNYLHTFLAKFQGRDSRLRNIPATAPFTPGQRDYIKELIDKIAAGK
jgi:hypothetical protein